MRASAVVLLAVVSQAAAFSPATFIPAIRRYNVETSLTAMSLGHGRGVARASASRRISPAAPLSPARIHPSPPSSLSRPSAVSPASNDGSSFNLLTFLRVIWDFSRPHTIIGSVLSVCSLHLFAAGASGLSVINLTALSVALVWALIPACFINMYVTGLNQVCDVEIDRINKPYLPIPAGRLSRPMAKAIVGASLVLGFALPLIFYPFDKGPLMGTIIGSTILGTTYSAPPIRLKRFPLFAALSIIVVRGTLINLGFYAHAASILGGPLFPLRSWLGAGFFAIFGSVIAMMKDVPDVEGDAMFQIRTLSVRVGAPKVLEIASTLLAATFSAVSVASIVTALPYMSSGAGLNLRQVCRLVVGFASTASALWVVRGSKAVIAGGGDVTSEAGGVGVGDGGFSKRAYAFYMQMWGLFYASYVALPLML